MIPRPPKIGTPGHEKYISTGENLGRAFLETFLPALHLIRVNLILARDLGNGLFPSHCLKRYTAHELAVAGFTLSCYFFVTGTTTQPEVDSVNSRAEKHQMTTFLPLIQAASFAALR